MKILLLTPFMSYKDRWGQYYKGAGDTFPIGIGSIAGYLEKHGIIADVLEPDICGMNRDTFLRHLEVNRYDVVGISAFTTNIAFAYETSEMVKGINASTRVVLGGSHPTLFPEKTLMECPAVDFIITNEGEEPFLQLIRCLERKTDLRTVPRLYSREGEAISFSGHQGEWLDLDDLPLYPYHKFDMRKYVPAPSLRKVLPTFNYMAQRGCPYACSFCDTRTHGKIVRYRSVEKVLDDLEVLKRTYGIKGLIFEGSNFTASPDWVARLCEGMIARRLNLQWYCMGRADLDIELLPLMKRAGLWCISFGIESANDKTLKRMKKHIKVEDVRQTVAAAKRLNLRTVGSFILGYPGEDERDVLLTIEYACQIALDVAVFFIPVPFPGTKLHEDALASGGLKGRIEWRDYTAWLDHNHPIYINPLLGDKHVRLYNYAFKRFYLRPSYIAGQLLSIRSAHDISRLSQGFKSVAGLIQKAMGIFYDHGKK